MDFLSGYQREEPPIVRYHDSAEVLRRKKRVAERLLDDYRAYALRHSDTAAERLANARRARAAMACIERINVLLAVPWSKRAAKPGRYAR